MKSSLSFLLLSLLVLMAGRSAASPTPAPPGLSGHRLAPGRGIHPAAVQLQYSIGEPTDEEQLFLELINRARANPTAEGLRLALSTHPIVLDAYQIYQVDLAKLKADLSTNAPAAPLAFEPHLIDAARGHTSWMLTHAKQAHEETDPVGDLDHIVNTTFDRILAAGYEYNFAGENVYAFSNDVVSGHAGFEVDWGVGPGGVQEELGHRNNNHSPNFTEVGIGILNGSRTAASIVQVGGTNTIVTNTVGPQVITVDFGSRFNQPALVTGVAHYDLNTNLFYDLGEGLSGVRVDIDSGSTYAVSSASGGYAIPAAEGVQMVTFSGPGLTPVQRQVTVSQGANVKLDLILPYTSPSVTPSSSVFVSVPNVFQCTPIPLATSYDLESGTLTAFSTTIDAKNGLGSMQPQVTTNAGVPAYSLVLADFNSTGIGFHLASASTAPQRLVLGTRLRVGTGSKINFATELAFSGTNQYARLEISSDGGSSWTKLWEQQGRAVNNSVTIEKGFTARSVSLAAFTGWECLFRFSYVVEIPAGVSGSYLAGTGKESGFFFNAISFTGVDQMTPLPTNSIPSSRFAVTPSVTGTQYYRVRPKVGTRSFPAGPIATATVATAPALVHLTNSVVGNGSVGLFPSGGTYAKGTAVSLTATPDSGWAFSGWTGGAAGTNNPLSLTLTADAKVTATFVPVPVALVTSVVGSGTIGVSPSPGPYPQGTLLTLTANPAPGWKFSGWSNGAAGTANPLILVMSADTTVVATFVPASVALNTSVEGQGTVTVSPSPGPYSPGSVVKLTATPAPGWAFSGWSGSASGAVNPLDLTLSADASVTAKFVPLSVQLTPSVIGNGTIQVSPPGALFPVGTILTLTAVPASGFTFTGWSGAATGSANPLVLTLLNSSGITATFTESLPPVVLIQGLSLGASGSFSLGFSITQGSGTSFSLESAATPDGIWSKLAVPVVTNSPGNFSFTPIVPSGTAGFYRVRVD